jgi:hypothetical protein
VLIARSSIETRAVQLAKAAVVVTLERGRSRVRGDQVVKGVAGRPGFFAGAGEQEGVGGAPGFLGGIPGIPLVETLDSLCVDIAGVRENRLGRL